MGIATSPIWQNVLLALHPIHPTKSYLISTPLQHVASPHPNQCCSRDLEVRDQDRDRDLMVRDRDQDRDLMPRDQDLETLCN